MSSSLYKTKVRKAAKQHECTVCGMTIRIGDFYRIHVGKGDFTNYEFSVIKECARCDPTVPNHICRHTDRGGLSVCH